MGKLTKSFHEPPSRQFTAMRDMWIDAGRPESALSMDARLRAGRDLMGIDHWLLPLFGLEGRSKAGWLGGGIPGMSVYSTRPLDTAKKKQRDILDRLYSRQSSLQNSGAPASGYEP
jgi:hypothetical protein